MTQILFERIYSKLLPEDFVGRDSEMEFLLRHISGKTQLHRLLLLAPPISGLSELLRQTFDTLFLSQEEIIPIYFSFSASQKEPRSVGLDFLVNFIWQIIAFRKRDPSLLSVSPTYDEIVQMLSAQDLAWANSFTNWIDENLSIEVFLKSVLSAPARAANSGLRFFLLVDDVHLAEDIGDDFLRIFRQSLENFRFPYVLAGRRRELLNVFGNEKAITLHLNPLQDEKVKEIIIKCSQTKNIKVTDQTIDLITRQLQGNPFLIHMLFEQASKTTGALDNYKRVLTAINEMLFSGALGRYFREFFDEMFPDKSLQKEIIKLLNETTQNDTHCLPFIVWERKLKECGADAHRLVRKLHINEVVQMTGANIQANTQNFLLYDYIESRYRIEILSEPRALVVGETLIRALKRAPQIMARFYRKNTSIGLKKLLTRFNYQEVPANLLDYGLFRYQLNQNDSQVLEKQADERKAQEENYVLPQVIYVAETNAFYPSVANWCDKGYSCTCLGLKASGEEVGWIVAQINSKSEVNRNLAEFWCDRLEIVAFICGFVDYKIWLIAPESFTTKAIELLKERGALSSNFRQIQMLSELLSADDIFSQRTNHDEYELVLPMGEDTELIAAHAIEEIARRAGFSAKSINQIKTALIEACINATEHSHSPDRKIYQQFKIEDDKLVITISNRGLKLPLENLEKQDSEGRRGWGFKLIRNLMDELKFVQTDDGVKLVMVKHKA